MPQAAEAGVVPYHSEWPAQFREVGLRIREQLGDLAIRIDHIGSTAVPGLDAKPIVDVQVSVVSLEPVAAYGPALERCGFLWRADNPERTQRHFRERPGAPHTHVHVRRQGSFSEQFALLFREYLRADVNWAARYAEEKRRLAPLLARDRKAYVAEKEPFVWETIRRADRWAQVVGWEPGATDT